MYVGKQQLFISFFYPSLSLYSKSCFTEVHVHICKSANNNYLQVVYPRLSLYTRFAEVCKAPNYNYLQVVYPSLSLHNVLQKYVRRQTTIICKLFIQV